LGNKTLFSRAFPEGNDTGSAFWGGSYQEEGIFKDSSKKLEWGSVGPGVRGKLSVRPQGIKIDIIY